ncbi:MAG: hypothetical protein JWM57_2467 [Phycisphaerales bacterium]|nr:hypothetical protein [Phycisphaerales bacterium]
MSSAPDPSHTAAAPSAPLLDDLAFLRRLMAASTDCIKVLDLDANLLAMNEGGQRSLEIVELTPHLGTCWTGWWTGKNHDAAAAAVEAAKAGGTGHFIAGADTFGGTAKWWDVTVTAIPDASGRPERLLSISRDITAQQVAFDVAAERSDRLKSIIASAQDYAVISIGLDGRIDGWSTGAAHTFGWTESQAIGQAFAMIWTPEDASVGLPERELKKAEAQGAAPDNRWHERIDGRRIFVVGSTRTVRSADGRLLGYVKVCRDETDREAAGTALADVRRRLDAALAGRSPRGCWNSAPTASLPTRACPVFSTFRPIMARGCRPGITPPPFTRPTSRR